jgi:ribosomal protein L11 methyltransferase
MTLLIGKRFVVLRGFEGAVPVERLPLMLAHGRAFGSGEHETTRSCLEELEEVPISATARVLDLGCGTGILAVAAARMGAPLVIALDPDPDAIAAALAAIRLNGMAGIIIPLQGEIEALQGTHFDLIMANLYGDIILRIADMITSLLAPGGSLLLSGINYGDTYDVRMRYTRAGCTLQRERYLEDYSTLVFRRRNW